MLDMILALIFSQLPHPECWMPHSHWRLSIAFGLLCLLGSRLVLVFCVVVEFVSGGSCYLCICVIGLSEQRFQCTVKYVWHCGHFTVCTGLPQYLMCSIVLLPSWLKPYWYSAHRFILIQMWFVQNREGRLFPFLLIFFRSTQHLLPCCLLFLALFLFSNLTSLGFSGVDSRQSAVDWGIGKKPLFDDVCLSLGQDWWNAMFGQWPQPRLTDGCWEKPLSKLRIVSPTHLIFSFHSPRPSLFLCRCVVWMYRNISRRPIKHTGLLCVAPGSLHNHLDMYVLGVYMERTWHIDKTGLSCGFRIDIGVQCIII